MGEEAGVGVLADCPVVVVAEFASWSFDLAGVRLLSSEFAVYVVCWMGTLTIHAEKWFISGQSLARCPAPHLTHRGSKSTIFVNVRSVGIGNIEVPQTNQNPGTE